MDYEFLKQFGMAGGFLFVFLIYHNAQRKADRELQNKQLETQKALMATQKTLMDDNAAREEKNRELLVKLIDEQRASDKESAEIMKEFLEAMNIQIAQNARIETKIDSNTSCPVVRENRGAK